MSANFETPAVAARAGSTRGVEAENRALAQRFPENFVWGVATSAYQIEGAVRDDGRRDSIWDEFCRRPGVIKDGSSGERACDHYHLMPADVALIASLNVNAYRFSIAWPRVQPLGEGPWNELGFDFYDRLLDALLERNISPHITLYHWDLPQALQEKGGWPDRATVHRFVDYAVEVGRRFGDRAASITTHNEPWVIASLGHEMGIFAPGLKSRKAALQAAHHLLLSHGVALQALRAQGCKAELGIVLNQSPTYPASDSVEDRARARLEDGQLVRWYMDPLLAGSYPEDVLEYVGADAPMVESGDLAAIHQPLDYLGINYYTRAVASASERYVPGTDGHRLTDMGWEIYPSGLSELLLRLNQDYTLPPVYITENGAAFKNVLENGRIADTDRIAYLQSHIAAVADARDLKIDVRGYFVWSLLDNFEWADGYAKRFGIVYVDYQTQTRTLKDSAYWYRSLCAHARAKGAGRGAGG